MTDYRVNFIKAENNEGAKKYDIYDVVYIFLLGGLFGTVYEGIKTLIRIGVLEDRSGSILTPFNYVYGIGAILMFLVLYRIRNSIVLIFVGSILGGVVEYVLNWMQEIFLGSTSWNYSHKSMNIGGRTTLPFMLGWGFLCFIAVRFIFPQYLVLIHKIPDRLLRTISMVLIVLVCIDAVVSLSAVLRYTQRAKNIYYKNSISQIIDKLFNDSYMKIHFPNMRIK